MHRATRLFLPLFWIFVFGPVFAQMPFYTDNADVTDQGTLHFEAYNEYDRLQSVQYPDLRQNTANFKFNYGFPHGLEVDVDFPWLAISRAPGSEASMGIGDADTGVKWNFYKSKRPLRMPGLSASLYIEFPTGDHNQELGSGLTDYWLNSIAQEPLSDRSRINANFGFLFAGNTSTGVLGLQTTHGHVFTGGLSFAHDYNSHLSLGAELYGAIADTKSLGKDQLQALAGGQYQVSRSTTVTFAVLGGSHIASPRIGGQFGFEIDLPLARGSKAAKSSFLKSTPQTTMQWRSP
jgi:hypothetical protein